MGWWPAFNVADSAISIGMTVMVLFMIFGNKIGGGEETDDS